MTSPDTILPAELLVETFILVKVSSGIPALLPCLLTCKRWYEVGISVLCRDVVLGNSDLEPFVVHFPETHGPLVRTLTINVDYPLEDPDCKWWKDAAVLGTPKARALRK